MFAVSTPFVLSDLNTSPANYFAVSPLVFVVPHLAR